MLPPGGLWSISKVGDKYMKAIFSAKTVSFFLLLSILLPVTLLATTANPHLPAIELPYEALRKAAAPAMVSVVGIDGKGGIKHSSGFYVSPAGHVVTTMHVVGKEMDVLVWSPGMKAAQKMEVLLNYPKAHLSLLAPLEEHSVKRQPYLQIPKQLGVSLSGRSIVSYLFPGRKLPAATLVKVGKTFDPWRVAGLSHLGVTMAAFAMSADTTLHIQSTGAPCFDESGRLMGIASFVHRADEQKRQVTFVRYIVPLDYLVDLLALACHRAVQPQHGGDTRVLKAIVQRAEAGMAHKRLKAAAIRREAFLDKFLATLKIDEKALGLQKTKTRRRRKLTKAEIKQKIAILPARVQRVHKRHPDWSYSVLQAIYRRKAIKGMTKKQVRTALGRPRQIVRGGDRFQGQTCDLWFYNPSPMLSFSKNGKLIRIR